MNMTKKNRQCVVQVPAKLCLSVSGESANLSGVERDFETFLLIVYGVTLLTPGYEKKNNLWFTLSSC